MTSRRNHEGPTQKARSHAHDGHLNQEPRKTNSQRLNHHDSCPPDRLLSRTQTNTAHVEYSTAHVLLYLLLIVFATCILTSSHHIPCTIRLVHLVSCPSLAGLITTCCSLSPRATSPLPCGTSRETSAHQVCLAGHPTCVTKPILPAKDTTSGTSHSCMHNMRQGCKPKASQTTSK